jgi:hypothetical protein
LLCIATFKWYSSLVVKGGQGSWRHINRVDCRRWEGLWNHRNSKKKAQAIDHSEKWESVVITKGLSLKNYKTYKSKNTEETKKIIKIFIEIIKG